MSHSSTKKAKINPRQNVSFQSAKNAQGKIAKKQNVLEAPTHSGKFEHHAFTAQALTQLQSVVGNQAVQRLLAQQAHQPQNRIVQRRGFADPANPNQTRQWEGKGYMSREEGDERPAALAGLVDQYKKEMLTYIAHYIATQKGAGYYGPHISVIISGDNWNISVNSDVVAAHTANLQTDADLAKTHIDQCWSELDAMYRFDVFDEGTKSAFESDAVEAAYLAFRWAANKTNVRAIANAGPAAGRIVHGETRSINTLQGEAPGAGAPAHPGTALPAGAAGPLPPHFRRVVRAGGTKTPCFDCAWEMGKVDLNQAEANAGTGGAHGAVPHADTVGVGANGKLVSTMSPTFGPSFQTWQDTDFAHGRRNNAIILGNRRAGGRVAGFAGEQGQNYAALNAAYTTAACPTNMI